MEQADLSSALYNYVLQICKSIALLGAFCTAVAVASRQCLKSFTGMPNTAVQEYYREISS